MEIERSGRSWRVNGQREVRYWGGETDDEEERRCHPRRWRTLAGEGGERGGF